MENSVSQPSTLGRFARGFMSSGFNGLLMMGIFHTLSFAANGFVLATPLLTVIGSALVVTAAIAIFGGIMAVRNSPSRAPDQQMDERNTAVTIATERGLAQQQTIPSPAFPIVAADIAPSMQPDTAALQTDQPAQRNWADRPDIAQSKRNSIESILANGQSDKDHASAILAEQRAANITSRA